MRFALLATRFVLTLLACNWFLSSDQPEYAGLRPGRATEEVQRTIGRSEGSLNLVTWAGYAEDDWVRPFEEQTGCHVNATYVSSSDEMVTLMANGGGGRYDLVSASGDVSLNLIFSGAIRPINVNLIPDWKNFWQQFQAPSFDTINGVHYGVSLQWAPTILLYNSADFPSVPQSWSVIYDSKYAGRIGIADGPMQLADAALFLMRTDRRLGISDPYELKRPQFGAVTKLLTQQRLLVRYWRQPSDEIAMFERGSAIVGQAWPYQVKTLRARGVSVGESMPQEATSGWADSWMVAATARHPNCSYMWIRWVSRPEIQALQAISYGETPVNEKACFEMDKLQLGACAAYHADAPARYLQYIRFWKTPMVTCDDGKDECTPYSRWEQAWIDIRGNVNQPALP